MSQERGRGRNRGNYHNRGRDNEFRPHEANFSGYRHETEQPQQFYSNPGPPAPAYSPGPPAPAYSPGPPAPAYSIGPILPPNLAGSTISVVVHQQAAPSHYPRDEGFASNQPQHRQYQDRNPSPRNEGFASHQPYERQYQDRNPSPRDEGFANNQPHQRQYQDRNPPPRDEGFASNQPYERQNQRRNPPPRDEGFANNQLQHRHYQDRNPPPRDKGFANNQPHQRQYQDRNPPPRDEGFASNQPYQRQNQGRNPPPRDEGFANNQPYQRQNQGGNPPPRDEGFVNNQPQQRQNQGRNPPHRDGFPSNQQQRQYQERNPPPRDEGFANNQPQQRQNQVRDPPHRDGFPSNQPQQRQNQGRDPPFRDEGFTSNQQQQRQYQGRDPPFRGEGFTSNQQQQRQYRDRDPPPSYSSYENDRSSYAPPPPYSPPYVDNNNQNTGQEKRDFSSGGRSNSGDGLLGRAPIQFAQPCLNPAGKQSNPAGKQSNPAGKQAEAPHQKKAFNLKKNNDVRPGQSKSFSTINNSRDIRQNQHGQNRLFEKKPVPLLNFTNISTSPAPRSKVDSAMADNAQRKKYNRNYKNKSSFNQSSDGAGVPQGGIHFRNEMFAGAKARLDYEHQMAAQVPLERRPSLVSLPESTASETAARTKNNGRRRNRTRLVQQNGNEKFKSTPNLNKMDDNCSPEASDNSHTSISHPVNKDEQAKTEKTNRNSHKNWKQTNSKSSQAANQKPYSSRLTKAKLQMCTTFPDAATLEEIVRQNITNSGGLNKAVDKNNEEISFHFVPGSIDCQEGLSSCEIIFQASSKKLGKTLIKSMVYRLKKNLNITLECDICEVKQVRHTNKEKQEKGMTSPTSPAQINSSERVDSILENINPEEEEEEVTEREGAKTLTEKGKKHPQPVPTKISVVVDKFFLTQEDLMTFLSTILCDKFISFVVVAGSFSSTTSQTKCELLVPSKAVSQKIMKKLMAYTSADTHIKCFVPNSGKGTHLSEGSSNAQDFEAEKEKTIDEITKKSQKTLEVHKEKITAYEEALMTIKFSLSDGEVGRVEELAVIDKCKEAEKQESTFCARMDQLIERAKKMDALAANSKELSDLLQSAGVECERLKAALPIYARREDIVEKVSQNQVSIILGETGSGKSTQMTQYIHEAGVAGQGMIICTQPRKVAAITLAERVAKEMAGKVGGLVGYKTGLNKKVSAETKIVFATDHCLLNECLEDANFSRYSCVIVDEAHERSIYTDLLLGMLKACLPDRPDLRVIITSATIDPEIFIKYFSCSPELQVSGRTFPVEVIYSDFNESEEFEDFEAKAVAKAVEIHTNEEPGDILVFLTSSVDIMRCCAEFEKLMSGKSDFKCLPLHGQLPPDEQRRVFERLTPGIRKIVFATNCAETSITIDGIKYVVDTGVAKEMQYDAKRNICMLGTHVISKSSANQRKGRAGRTGSGKCYRLFTEDGYDSMRESTDPEILRVPLAQSVLKLAELGVDVKKYDFVQSPSAEAIDFALSTLSDLGALSFGCITDIGRWIAKLPFSPNEGFLIYHGNRKNLLYDSVVLASLIANGSNLFYKGLTESEAQSSAKSKNQFGSPYGDVFTWLEVYKTWLQIEAKKQSKWCQENSINYKVMSFTKQCVRDVATILKNEFQIILENNFSTDESAIESLRKIIFEGHMTSICCYLGHVRAGYHALVAERQVHIHPSSNLLSLNSQPEWIVYSELTKTSRDFIKGVTVVEEDWVLEAVRQRRLHVDINLAKQQRIELVHSEAIGSSVFRKLVGIRYSQLRVWEDDIANVGMKAVVVEADSELGTFNIFSTSAMNQDIAGCLTAMKTGVIESLQSEEYEIDIIKKSGSDPSGVRIVLGQGGCVNSVLMPNQSNKILIKNTTSETTEEIIREKFQVFGDIKEFVRFRHSNPWGFVRYSSTKEANAAVENTRRDKENIAVLKIDRKYKKMVSKFEARLSWCRRPVKGTGTAFIKCPPIERAGLIDKEILLPDGYRQLKLPKSGNDLVCFKTGAFQEAEIKKAVMQVLNNDQDLIQDIQVTVVREQALNTTQEDLNGIKDHLTNKFSNYVPKGKFSIHLMSAKGNAVYQVAFIHFESPTDGFRACRELQGQLQVQGQRVEISPTLKTTLHVPAAIMNVCKDRFSKIVTDLETYKATEVNIRSMKTGDYAFDIKSEDIQSMIEARELLQKEMEGEIIDCKVNDLVGKLLRRQGKEALRKIESSLDILIMVNERSEQVRIYGTEKNVSQAQVEINHYLCKLAEGKQTDVFLRGEGKPAGLMKELMRKYANLQEDLIQSFSLSDVIIDFKQQKLSIFGPQENVDRALASISEVESALSQSSVVQSKKGMPDCVACMGPVESSSEMYRLEACGHCYCFDCFKLQLSVSEQEKRFPVVCAKESCVSHLVWKDFRFCLQKHWTTEEKLADKSVSAYVSSNPDKYRFCLTPECPVVYEVTTDEDGVEFNCPSCFISLCTSCHTAFHAGLTCSMQSINEKELQSWVMEDPKNRKFCPGCHVGVEKTEGCNHMACQSCHIHFCWLCLETFTDEQKCYAHLMKTHGSFY